MSDDELKRKILARRAKFAAAAIASVGALGAEACGTSQPCLFPAVSYDAATPDSGDPSFPDATGPVVDGSVLDGSSEASSDASDADATHDGGDGG